MPPKTRVVSPALDNFLTLLFFLEVLYMSVKFYEASELSLFLTLFLLSGLAIEAVRWVFGVSAFWFSRRFLQHLGDPMADPSNLKKAKDQAWQLVVHVSMTLFEAYIMGPGFEWWNQTEHAWIPWPTKQANHWTVPFFYLTQLAIWTATAVHHRFVESKKKDYVVMYIHHLSTIMLVFGSHFVMYWRIGIIVLFVHDFSDIFIDLLKLSGHFNMGGRRAFFFSEIAFVSSLVAWVYFRLYRFPAYVIYSAVYYSRVFVTPEPNWMSLMDHLKTDFWAEEIGIWWQANILLLTLLILHIWWFYLLCRIAYKIIVYGDTKRVEGEMYEVDKNK